MVKTYIRYILFFFLLFNTLTLLYSQNKFTVSGKVTDVATGEDLIGATIYIPSISAGASTNAYGFYSLTLLPKDYIFEISYMGYKSVSRKISLTGNTTINFTLSANETELNEVVISTKGRDQNLKSTDLGVEKLSMKKIETIPVLFGERDILKTIQLLPGIGTVSEGSSGFSVRGGSIDQNLILLDEAPVYSASHLMGFFSVFNADAIKDVSIYKGGIPANYGGRASSVLDITMRDGNNQKFAVSGGIGLISSRLTVEGPIIKDKMSFIVSARRSYADLVGRAIGVVDTSMSLYFYDLNAKLNYKINDNNTIYLSGYFGKDDFGFGTMGTSWGNTTGTLRWNHLFSNKLFSNTILLYSDYNYGFNLGTDMRMASGIEDYSLKQDFTLFKNPDNTMKFGFSSNHHTFNPGELIFSNNGVESTASVILDKKQALESAVYISNNQKINSKLSVDYGLRLSMFNQLGEGWQYTYDNNNLRVDSTHFNKGQLMQTYFGLEPRLALNYRITDQSSIKASFNRMSQYMHLLSNSTSGQPTDTWIPSSSNVKPLTVSQFSVGYFRNFFDNNLEFSIETYYKNMKNVSDYEDGADLLLNVDVESQILNGHGRSYGAEFYLKKSYGKLTGWISYTLSRTENQIEGINDGKWYKTSYDKTHDLSIVASYQFAKRASLSATWIFYTGSAVTFPSGKYEYGGNIISYYTERNGYRMPDNHRLDLNLHLDGKASKRFKSSWDFSIYNAYDRKNAYSISFRDSKTNPGTTEAVKLSLFGIIPSVTWNFNF